MTRLYPEATQAASDSSVITGRKEHEMPSNDVDVCAEESGDLGHQLEYTFWSILDWEDLSDESPVDPDTLRRRGEWVREEVDEAAAAVRTLQNAGWVAEAVHYQMHFFHPTIVFRDEEDVGTYLEQVGLEHVGNLIWSDWPDRVCTREGHAVAAVGQESPGGLLDRFKRRAEQEEQLEGGEIE